MKRLFKPLMFTLILVFFIALTQNILAQGPPPPPSEKGSTSNHDPEGPTGSPIDPGTGIFLILAAGYGMKKVYNARKKAA
jgi:hypothetical protein